MPPSPRAGSRRPAVFVSYSQADRAWLDNLLTLLAPLEQTGLVRTWSDEEAEPGQRRHGEIAAALAAAQVGVFLVSAHSLASRFIMDVALPHFLAAAGEGRATILWALLAEAPYEETALQDLPALHDVLRPLQTLPENERENVLQAICRAIAHAADAADAADAAGTSSTLPPFDFGRLPNPGPYCVGREAELARLDAAWESPRVDVLTWVAAGGMGKSTVVKGWLDSMARAGWRGARRGLAWSFHSWGTEERGASADRFLDHALSFFGAPAPAASGARERGLWLAGLLRRERTLLVLDGIEPLQHPPGPLAGQLRDPGLAALLQSLAAGHPGLCIVTTRERIADLADLPRNAPQVSLEALTPEAGAELLRELGVGGQEAELWAASTELGNHPLALTLLGNYLRRAWGGDVRRRREVDRGPAATPLGGQALRIVRAYARWLGEGPEVAVLRLLGLFDRPAAREALAALRAKPEIPGLTEPLMRKKRWWQRAEPLSEEAWQWAVSSLGEQGLLLCADPRGGALDAHPLVRAYFQEELERERPRAWQEGNLRLYEHLKGVAPDPPDTLEAMEPLYAAVIHGCRAGRQQEAVDEVYWQRILGGEGHFCWHRLGAFGADLAALAAFFDRPWDQPSARLRAAAQSFVLNDAALDLRALGRLAEAVAPMQAGLERYLARGHVRNAAIAAGNLSELTLILGEVERAVALGEQCVALADQSGDAFLPRVSRTTLADALHQAGRWGESAVAFRQAEALQREEQRRNPRLYSLQGYRYCDLLLGGSPPEGGSDLEGLAAGPGAAQRFREVRGRAWEALQYEREGWYPLLSISLDHLSLGRSHLGLALVAATRKSPGGEVETELATAAEHLDCAVEGLRRVGPEDDLPRGLLARATLHRLGGDLAGAAADLAEAMEIAERGGMRLHLCDIHLEETRLALRQADLPAARRHVALARRLVVETGYGRREREVAWLEEGASLARDTMRR
jgi:tetratricopeptide (TPR) repeat protein